MVISHSPQQQGRKHQLEFSSPYERIQENEWNVSYVTNREHKSTYMLPYNCQTSQHYWNLCENLILDFLKRTNLKEKTGIIRFIKP